MSEKIKTAVMEVIKAHMEGEDKNTKAVLSDILESVNELEALEQQPCDECRNKHTSICGNCKEYDEYEPCDNAISREAVLDTLDRMDKALDENRTVEDYKALLIECYKVLTPVTQKSGKWIPVSERLPEEAFGCLVTILDTDLKTQDEFENILPYAVGYDGETWNNFCGEPIPFEVVAWMPLPTPYEPQESEGE